MTEDLPRAAKTVKGRTRAAMTAELLAAAGAGRVRIAIGGGPRSFPRAWRYRSVNAGRAGLRQCSGLESAPTSSGILACRTPTAMCPTSPPGAGHPRHRRPRGWRGRAPARPADRHHPVIPRPGRRRGRASGRHPVAAQAGRARAGPGAPTRRCASWPGRCRISSTSPSSWIPASTSRCSAAGGILAGHRHHRDRDLVPDPAGPAMTTTWTAGRPAPCRPGGPPSPARPEAASAADLTPVVAWSRRVRSARSPLLYLDHLVRIRRYRVAGWVLTAGPVILVATMSGSALAVTTGIAACVALLGTAAACFHA